MEQFAVFHITKFKSLGGIGAHIDRRHIWSNVNEAKTDFNEPPSRCSAAPLN